MRNTWSADQTQWLTVLLCAVVILGMTVPANAQTPSCTTLGPQCAPATFGDDGQFTLGAQAKCCARQVVSHGIMPLCGGDMFCPQALVTRADMAVFLENAHHLGTQITLLAATGVFSDVPISFPLACWVEAFYHDGFTAGCGTNPLRYCPDASLSRAQMAVFILLTMHGNTYTPPPCSTPGQPQFNDVACPSQFADWISEFVKECISAGCPGGNFCPNGTVTREQMGVFLWDAFLTSSPCTASCS